MIAEKLMGMAGVVTEESHRDGVDECSRRQELASLMWALSAVVVKYSLNPEAAGHPSGPAGHTRRCASSNSGVPIFVVLAVS
jgi:hypothetical protein